MKITFKHLLYALVLIGFITLSFTLCSKHAVHPLFEKQPDFQNNLIYQKDQETKLKPI